jgi:hypothetical protein
MIKSSVPRQLLRRPPLRQVRRPAATTEADTDRKKSEGNRREVFFNCFLKIFCFCFYLFNSAVLQYEDWVWLRLQGTPVKLVART